MGRAEPSTAISDGAPSLMTQQTFGVGDRYVAVGARVVRARCLAALRDLAQVIVTVHVGGVGDRRVAARATDGVAQTHLPRRWNWGVARREGGDLIFSLTYARYFTIYYASLSRRSADPPSRADNSNV